MIVKGKEFILAVGMDNGQKKAICHSRSCSFQRERETVETSGPEGADKRYLPSYKGGSISCESLVAYTDDITLADVLEWLEAGSKLYYAFFSKEMEGLVYSGQLLVTRCEVTGEYTGYCEFSFEAVMDGPFVINKNDVVREVSLAGLDGVRLVGCPNPYPVTVLWYDGSLIGIAYNASDVITQFNSYPSNTMYRLIGTDGGCDFTMAIKWNSPIQPTFVPGRQGLDVGLWIGLGDAGISPSEDNNDLLTPVEYA